MSQSMTSEQAIKSLSPAQRRLYERLQRTQEPAGLWLTRRERQSAAVLMRMAWVERVNLPDQPSTYRLTCLGKLIAGPIEFTPEGANR